MLFGAVVYLLAGWPPELPARPESWPSWATIQVWLRSPILPVEWLIPIVRLLAWFVWGWTCFTVVVRVAVNILDAVTRGAAWVRSLREATNWLTLPLVRRAVDASLAGLIMVRVAMPLASVAHAAETPAAIVLESVLTPEHPMGRAAAVGLARLSADSVFGAERSAAQRGDLVSAEANDLVYTIKPGDTWWGIAEQFYGDGARAEQLLDANLDRQEPDGRRITRRGLIFPGWTVRIPGATQGIVEELDGQRWYTVARGDTLSGIAGRLLGDTSRWPEVFELNRGKARVGNGYVLENPSLIWPGLRLQLPAVESVAEDNDAIPSEPASSTTTCPVAPEQSSTSVDAPVIAIPLLTPNAPETGTNGTGDDANASARVALPDTDSSQADASARATPEEAPLVQWPQLSLGEVAAGLGGAAAVSAAVWIALRTRRRVSEAHPAESDTAIDTQAFTRAAPAAVLAARRDGGDDPHGIVLGELLAGELIERARQAGLLDVEVVSVSAGRSWSTVVLATSLRNRAPLEATLRAAHDLARRVDVTRSQDQDVVMRLEGLDRAALARVSLDDGGPLLLCLGLQPDGRAYLAGWEALGHVLVATQPGTADAQEHLAALVATLAGQRSPAELRLYTLAAPDTALGQLGPLPHQSSIVDACEPGSAAGMLAGLRAEVEGRQQHGPPGTGSAPELVLVVGELGQMVGEEDLAYLLRHGRECGVRVLAAVADTTVARGVLVESFETRIVFGLEDEEASIRLLGKPWALTLAEPGRLLVREGRRKEVDIRGLRLTNAGRADLFAEMGVRERETGDRPVPGVSGRQSEDDSSNSLTDHKAETDDDSEAATEHVRELVTEARGSALVDSATAPFRAQTLSSVEPFEPTGLEGGGRDPSPPVNGEAVGETRQLADIPLRIAQLATRASLVVNTEDASVWSADGRLSLEGSSLTEVLLHIAAAPLLEQGPLDRWAGVRTDSLLEEVWAPRARDPRNRESGHTWLRKSLSRLRDEVARAAGGLAEDLIVERGGGLQLNPAVAVSDVEAFIRALDFARKARGGEQIAAAEQALVLRVPALLADVPRERAAVGRTIELYRWLDLPHWESAGRRLEALGRESMGLLGRAYREAGRHAAALAVYRELVSADPLDQRAQEGLLLAAAGTGDLAQLREVWEQICACLGGDVDLDVRALYERVLREVQPATMVRST